MATNPYLNNFYSVSEQQLIEDLVVESIKFYGHDINYLIRDTVEVDEIYGEAPLSKYERTYPLEMYIRTFDSYAGDGVFLSKFNLEIRDQVVFAVAIRRFNDDVGSIENISRPREGDIIHMPMDNRLYQISYVNKTPVFYQTGALQFYELTAEVFEYSNEIFNTGIPEIDEVYRDKSMDMNNYAILTQDGYMITDENYNPIIQAEYNPDDQANDVGDDSDEIQDESEDIIDWSETDPFSEGNI